MNPDLALWLILGITLLSVAAQAPLAYEARAELARAKKNLENYAALAISTALLGVVSFGLWWYYALTTDQLLLAIIPTVSLLWGLAVKAITNTSHATRPSPHHDNTPTEETK